MIYYHKISPICIKSSKMIQNNNNLDDSEHSPHSKLRIIGYFPNKHEQQPNQITIHPQTLIHDNIVTIINKRKFPYLFQPIFIAAQLSCIAIIDTKHRAWLITDFMDEPLCISELLMKKVYSLSLSSTQLIVQTNTGHILLNWGRSKSISDQFLQKISDQNSKQKESHFFQIFNIRNSKREDHYFFSTLKKIADQNSLYAIQGGGTIVRGYPETRQIGFKKRVLGISIGKHYKLCWDETGKLYSWGCKSIGLGHATIPDQDYIMEPREVQLINGHVIKAYADVDYSLAITLDGKLYEWGVKTIDSKNQEIILQPRQIQIPSPKYKCIDLKGNYSKYGVLTLSGQLFIWGKNAKQFFNKKNIHLDWQSDNTITSPMLLPQQEGLIDFEISESFILVIVNTTNYPSISPSQKRYWLNLKQNIKDNLTLRTNIKTEGSDSNDIIRKLRLSEQKNYSMNTFRKMKKSIEVALSKRKSKQEYFEATALDSQKVIQSIMQPNKRLQQSFRPTQDYIDDYNPVYLPTSCPKQHIRISPRFSRLVQQFQKEKDYVKLLVNRVPNADQRHKMARLPRNASQKINNPYTNSKTSKPYQNRLMDVLKKKEKYETLSLLQTIKKVENKSFEFRIKKIQENEEHRKKQKEIQIYKHTIQHILIKQFLVQLFSTPTTEARNVKIANFARSLKLTRIQKNIRSLFTRARVKFQIQRMQNNQIFRFFQLVTVFRTYVKRFRIRKQKSQRKLIVNSCLKSVVKQKIKAGVAACIFNVRKLQKFREWLTIVRQQRQRCLKYLWKVHLLSMMKINCDNDNSTIFHLPKNMQELTFQSLYQDRVTTNPLLNLKNFLNKFSIFRIKANYFQKLVTLFSHEQKKSKFSNSKTAKFTIFGRGRKVRIKLNEDQSDKQGRLNLMHTDVLPYSLHYNLLIHPKNYDLALSEMAKINQKWIKFERTLLEKYINLIITSHQQNFLRKKREHDVQLAHFIRKNYQLISEKRWRFILQFNQIQKKPEHDKKERQLRRLMKLITATHILDQDCIPQQQYVLDQAKRRYDAPTPPNPHIIFNTTEFRQLFRIYYQELSAKVKQLKRSFA